MEILVPDPDWPDEFEAQKAEDEFIEYVDEQIDESLVADRQMVR